LAKNFDISLPAFTKHIKILQKSRLIRCHKIGRTTYCRLNYQPLVIAWKWLSLYEKSFMKNI
jgi:DNA-binding transcriptional ArsR family regulator